AVHVAKVRREIGRAEELVEDGQAVGDDGQRARQRLTDRDTPALLVARRNEQTPFAQDPPLHGFRDEAGPLDGPRDGELVRPPACALAFGPRADHDEARIRDLPRYARPGLDRV